MDSLVSVIIIFLNAERFIEEAIQSVFVQSYPYWELLLVDDGSSDSSTGIAHQYALRYPHQVYYLQHDKHANRDMPASRNLGVDHSHGRYVAFLDADDVWLPYKLEQQVGILDLQPKAAMVYGLDQYWYSWTSNSADRLRDYLPKLGVRPLQLIVPPVLLVHFLQGRAAVPCPSGIMVRRKVLERVGGFDESFQGKYNIYEDQAFYAKLCLREGVIATDTCWVRYRQHPDASTALAHRTGQETAARLFFLGWLASYLTAERVDNANLWHALRCELWRIRFPVWLPPNDHVQHLARWVKKWMLRAEDRLLPTAVRYWLHKQGRRVRGCDG